MLKVYGIDPAKKELKGITRDIRVIWALEELNLKYEYILLDPSKGENRAPEYLKLNLTGKIPTLYQFHLLRRPSLLSRSACAAQRDCASAPSSIPPWSAL